MIIYRMIFLFFSILLIVGCQPNNQLQESSDTVDSLSILDPDFERYVDTRLTDMKVADSDKKELKSMITNKESVLGYHINPLGILEPPISPSRMAVTSMPENSETKTYEASLSKFHAQRLILSEITNEYVNIKNLEAEGPLDGFLFAGLDYQNFAARLLELNGSIFWAPASKAPTNDIVNQAGDEVRAVFGPIPPFDLTTLGVRTTSDGHIINTKQSGLEVDGNFVVLKPNPNKPGNPYEWEHKDINGNIVKWSASIPECDKPSLAGGVTPCGTASRISRVTQQDSPVEWIALARKSKRVQPLDTDKYWSPDDPNYALIGYIGFNPVSGELAFFDGVGGGAFDWTVPTVPPGGSGYDDTTGRMEAAITYDPSFRIGCHDCHINLDPIIATPYMKLSRVGYRDSNRSAIGSVGDIFPQNIRKKGEPYRVVGTGYTSIHKKSMEGAYIIGDPEPEQLCTGCHAITSATTTASRFVADSVGRLKEFDTILDPGNSNPGLETTFRTMWSGRDGDGGIHPWMVPVEGADISSLPTELSEDAWNRLKGAMLDPSAVAGSLKVFTQIPAPESGRSETTRTKDRSVPKLNTPKVEYDNGQVVVSLHWEYHNSFGKVPTRDDVRFHIAIKEVDNHANGAEPQLDDYPSMDEVKGEKAALVADQTYRLGDVIILKNISYKGHEKWTDPKPTSSARVYQVKFPAIAGKRYLVRYLPKRFGFDQEGIVYSVNTKHTQYIDVPPNK